MRMMFKMIPSTPLVMRCLLKIELFGIILRYLTYKRQRKIEDDIKIRYELHRDSVLGRLLLPGDRCLYVYMYLFLFLLKVAFLFILDQKWLTGSLQATPALTFLIARAIPFTSSISPLY